MRFISSHHAVSNIAQSQQLPSYQTPYQTPYQNPYQTPGQAPYQPSILPLSPQRPYVSQPTSPRTLHLVSQRWGADPMNIFDTDNSTLLYTTSVSTFKPHFTVRSALSNAIIATVVDHSLTARIDIILYNQPITLNFEAFWKGGQNSFTSLALPGEVFTWKERGEGLVCTEKGGGMVAKFEEAGWSRKKIGKMELMGERVREGYAMEEVVVTGLVMVQKGLVGKHAANLG